MKEFQLRAWEINDAEALAQAADNFNIAKNLRNVFPNPYTLDDAIWYINDSIANVGKKQLNYAIVIDGQAVGSIGIFVKDDVYAKRHLKRLILSVYLPSLLRTMQPQRAFWKKQDLHTREQCVMASTKMEKFIPTVCILFCERSLLSEMGRKGTKTKEAIRCQAYQLFAEKGFKAVTMTDICEKTGLSRGGLYRYYSGTGQIFSEILSEEYAIADRIEKKEKASVILEDMLEAIKAEIMEKELSLSLAIYEYANLGNEDFFTNINNKAKKRWISLLKYGIETKEFQPVDVEQVSDLILYYYQGLRMWSRVISFDEQVAENYVRTVRQLLLREEKNVLCARENALYPLQ